MKFEWYKKHLEDARIEFRKQRSRVLNSGEPLVLVEHGGTMVC